jgi:hypothetical protein
MERLKDDGATFTTAEVRALIEWHADQARRDELYKSRLAMEQDAMARRESAATDTLKRLEGMFEQQAGVALKVVTDDGKI